MDCGSKTYVRRSSSGQRWRLRCVLAALLLIVLGVHVYVSLSLLQALATGTPQ